MRYATEIRLSVEFDYDEQETSLAEAIKSAVRLTANPLFNTTDNHTRLAYTHYHNRECDIRIGEPQIFTKHK